MDDESLSAFESGSRVDTSADTIGSFIADWVQIKYFYSEAASLAQELCETLLASNAIRAIVTHRVKQGHRLEAKLRERVRKLGREYRSAREIRDDVVDLAGVRIALYFPSDREKIDKIIHDAFAEVTHKAFPDHNEKSLSDTMSIVTDTSLDFQQRFHGYSADHYHVRMRVENLATKKLRDDFQKTNPMIEIQVASVLMHAWAEIDHDLVYKTLTGGPASQQELRLLDATNGLVHTGEVLLQQLQTAMDDRVAYQNKKFSEQYELLGFLRGQIKNAKGSMEHLDVLLLVLKITGLDSPRRLGQTLEGCVIPPKSTAPIALVILEHILGSLGEEQRRTNNLYLRPRSVHVPDLEVDRKNPKCYLTNVETRDKMLDQRDILEMTVAVADVMRFPEKSILVVEGMPQKFKKFYTLYNQVHFANVKESQDSEQWLCEISLRELDPLWTWFETNDDVLFRVSLLLARLNVEDIDRELIKLRPSSGFQRLPSALDPNPGYLSPGNMSPGMISPGGQPNPGFFSRTDSRNSIDTEPKPTQREEKSTPTKPSTKRKSLQKKKHNKKQVPSMPEPIEENEEDSSLVTPPDRTRRPYTDLAKPEYRKSTQYASPSAQDELIEQGNSTPKSTSPRPPDSATEYKARQTSNNSRPRELVSDYQLRRTANGSRPRELASEYVSRQTTNSSRPRESVSEYVPRHANSRSRPSAPPRTGPREGEYHENIDVTPPQPEDVSANFKAYVEDDLSDHFQPEPRRIESKSQSPSGAGRRMNNGAQYQTATSSPGESVAEVLEAPEPPDLEIRPDDAYYEPPVLMPEESSIPRRRNTGRSQRNDYYRPHDLELQPRFEDPNGGLPSPRRSQSSRDRRTFYPEPPINHRYQQEYLRPPNSFPTPMYQGQPPPSMYQPPQPQQTPYAGPPNPAPPRNWSSYMP